MTVVSAWPAASGEHQTSYRARSSSRRRASAALSVGARGGRVVAAVAPAPAPARQQRRQQRERARATTATGTQPDREAEAAVLGLGEDAGPVGALELGLDLLLGQPLRDEPADRGALLVGAVGLGDVQRHVARVAHDLVLDVVEATRAAPRRRRGRRGQREQRQQRDQRRRASARPAPRSMARVEEVLGDLAARHGHHVAAPCRARTSRAASSSRTSARGRAGRRAGSGR